MVAGIAMGLITNENGNYSNTLTDIQGAGRSLMEIWTLKLQELKMVFVLYKWI